MVALSAVFMLFSYFPYLTYAIPAITGLFMVVLVIEINRKWAVTAYIAAAAIIFMFSEPESKLLYICLFGYYPILKSIIEQTNKAFLEWFLKIITFNAAVILIYLLFSKLFGVSVDDFKFIGKYGAALFLILGNVIFVIYDIAVSRMVGIYMSLIHPKINKILFK